MNNSTIRPGQGAPLQEGAGHRLIRAGWRVFQVVTVAGALGVVGLLLARPELGLWLTWDLLIPLVPAVLLISPQVWRNACPIAWVSQLPVMAGRGGARRISQRVQRFAPAIAATLLLAIVPLRLVLFNENGPALALFVVVVLSVALVGGILANGKAGWCATFCPVLPVERLYGQSPLIETTHAHCASCTGCIRACWDLAPAGSLARLTGANGPRSTGTTNAVQMLHHTPMGLFAAAFPGFVMGYFSAPESPTVLQAYAWVMGGAAICALLVLTLQGVLRVGADAMVRFTAAAAIAIYYWFAVPAVAAGAHEMFALPAAPATGIAVARALAIATAGAWLLIATGRAAATRAR